jgi:hypothetical protein
VGIPPTGAEMMPVTVRVPAAALIEPEKAQRLYHGLNVDHSSLILIKGTTVS